LASLLAIGLLLPLAALCFGVGARVLRPLRLPYSRMAEEIVFAVPVGMGVIAYLVLALGLLGALRLWPVVGLLVALAALSIREVGRLLLAVGRRLCGPRRRAPGRVWVVAAFLLVMALLTLLGALAPAGQNDWDGLSYHLAAPKIYLQEGRIVYLPWMSHSNFPFTPEMLYTLGLLLEGQRLAKLFNWLAGVLLLAAVAQLGALAGPRRAGIAAAAILAATPIVAWEATTAGNDLTVTLYTALALLAFVRWARTDRRGWLWACGIACGLALGTKPTSLVVLAFLCAAAAWQVGRRRGWRPALGAAAGLALLACAIGAPWYIKSAVWTGNPVYPFFYGVFGGKHFSAEAARLYRAEQLSFGMGHGLGAFLLHPWNLTVHPQQFFNFPDKPLAYVSIGPLYLAFVPLLALAGRPSGTTRFLLAFAAAFAVGWFLLSQHIRYFIPLLPAAAVLAGVAAAAAARVARWARVLVAGLLCVAGLAAVGIALLVVVPGAPAAAGIETDDACLARTLDIYPVVRYVNTMLPRDARVLTLGETRGFYFDRAYMWGDPGQHEIIPYDAYQSADELVDDLAGRGFTHVLMGLGFVRGLQDDSTPLARLFNDAIKTGRLEPVPVPADPRRGRAWLFRLRPLGGG